MDSLAQKGKKPLSLGVRLVQAYYLIVLLLGILYAAFINPKADLSFVYDFSMIRAIIQMWTSAQAVWLLQRRSKYAKPYCMASTVCCTVMSVIDTFVFGAHSIVYGALGSFGFVAFVLVEYVFAIAAVLYLALSKDVTSELAIQPNMQPEGEGNSWTNVPYKERVRTWPFWRDTTIYFIVFSFLGHWAEMLFCRLIVAGVFMGDYDPTNAMLWDQWLFPFSAEGIALAMVVLFLHPLKEWLLKKLNNRVVLTLIVSFLVTAIVCTLIDFLTGMVANQHYELWDYRSLPFNFMGQVCLQNSMVYSIAATLIVWVIYPLMDRQIRKMPSEVTNIVFVGLVGFYAFEVALHWFNF